MFNRGVNSAIGAADLDSSHNLYSLQLMGSFCPYHGLASICMKRGRGAP